MSTQPDPAALQELLDKTAIGELQTRYMYAIDWHDGEMYAGVFTEDGVLEWPEGFCKGRAEIRASVERIGKFYRTLNEATPNLRPARKRHFVTNRIFDIKGDKARSWCYWFDTHNDNLQRWPYVPAYGYYEDDLVRTGEGWLFAKRKIYNEIAADSPFENPLRNTL
jgi:hypothetical protein